MPKFTVHEEDFRPTTRNIGRQPMCDVTEFIETMQDNKGQWVSVDLGEKEAKSTQRQLKKRSKEFNLQIVSRMNIEDTELRTIMARIL